jgi:hypothetical protein
MSKLIELLAERSLVVAMIDRLVQYLGSFIGGLVVLQQVLY